MAVKFSDYTFNLWLLTTRNVYEPAQFAIIETPDGLVARAGTLTYGDGSGTAPGLLEVTFARQENGFSWQARAAHAEPIKGIKVAVTPLPLGKVMVPLNGEVDLKEGEPGRCFIYPGGYYPVRHVSSTFVEPHSGALPIWAAQFALFRNGARTVYVHAREYPPRVKKLWIYRRGEHQECRIYDEADARRRATEYATPTWYLDDVPDWREAVDDHAHWMAEAFGLQPFAERADAQPWLKQIGLVVLLHGLSHDGKVCHNFADMARRLEELAPLYSPQRTLVKLLGFEGRIDRHWPDNGPALELGGDDGFRYLVKTAHRLGFHVMPHLNVWGASFDNPATDELLAYRILDGEGRPVNWSYDYDQDEIAEEIFAYISPDAPEWRAVLRQKVREIVERGVDAIFLDQTGTFVNDLRYDHFRGLQALYDELRAELPDVQFACEGPTTELSASLCPLLAGVSGSDNDDANEMYRRLFGPYVRQHSHSASIPPEPYRGVWSVPPITRWNEEHFMAHQERAARTNGIPTLNLTDLRIRLDGAMAANVLERARRYGPESGQNPETARCAEQG